MLHEILLSLSGHPSPLLGTGPENPPDESVLSPPERALLTSAGHLSALHRDLIDGTSRVAGSHPSIICRAAASAVASTHLAAFRKKVLEVESGILRDDPGLVGAYHIVPLTAVVGEFTGWTRRLEWLWGVVRFMLGEEGEEEGNDEDGGDASRRSAVTGACLINKLRAELQTGYPDIEEAALTLIRAAETAWIRQLSAWVLYGRIPTFGEHDFFIQRDETEEHGYSCNRALIPEFVTPSTANSILFIGSSLNRVRTRGVLDASTSSVDYVGAQLRELAALEPPLKRATLARAIKSIRLTLSRVALQKLLPNSKVLELLQLLRDFFLLSRGEFAMYLTQQADEKIRNRWKRADNLAHEKRDGLGGIMIKEGEVSAVLARTWAALGSALGQHVDEDEGLELARSLLRLELVKSEKASAATSNAPGGRSVLSKIATTPFQNLLFSVPVVLTMGIPQPLDLFFTTHDLHIYMAASSYLLSLRRAHLRLTDLWKLTSLRRHHPAPPRPPYSTTKGGRMKTQTLRERASARSSIMRRPWSTAGAAIFFLAETEAYFQAEVVETLWRHFHDWVVVGVRPAADSDIDNNSTDVDTEQLHVDRNNDDDDNYNDQDDESQEQITSAAKSQQNRHQQNHEGKPAATSHHSHDPQTLASAHRRYLTALTRRLLLTRPSFTDPLHALLVAVDRLVSLVRRLDALWIAADLEADEGVVDAFSDHSGREEAEVMGLLGAAERDVRAGVGRAVTALRALSLDEGFLGEMEGGWDGSGAAGGGGGGGETEDGEGGGGGDNSKNQNGGGDGRGGVETYGRGRRWNRDVGEDTTGYEMDDDDDDDDEGRYRPPRVGGIDRLLMKLDFGGWFADGDGGEEGF